MPVLQDRELWTQKMKDLFQAKAKEHWLMVSESVANCLSQAQEARTGL